MSEIPGLAPGIPANALERVSCGLCGSPEQRLVFRDEPFAVVRCLHCDLTYVSPRLRAGALLEHVYDEGYWNSGAAKLRGYTDYGADAPLYLRTYRRRFEVIERHFKRPGRVLDVGCAAGYFLEVARERGWHVTGIEPSDAIRPRAIERLGEEHVHGGLLDEHTALPLGSFDLVTFWDVIEHIPDPVAALARARSLLKPTGKLLIETQDVRSRAARVLGKRWQHYKHAEHIYHFHAGTIGQVLRKSGFQLLENTPRLGGKYVSLAFVAERAGRVHPLLSVLLSPLKLAGQSAFYVNLRDEMIVVAKPA